MRAWVLQLPLLLLPQPMNHAWYFAVAVCELLSTSAAVLYSYLSAPTRSTPPGPIKWTLYSANGLTFSLWKLFYFSLLCGHVFSLCLRCHRRRMETLLKKIKLLLYSLRYEMNELKLLTRRPTNYKIDKNLKYKTYKHVVWIKYSSNEIILFSVFGARVKGRGHLWQSLKRFSMRWQFRLSIVLCCPV